METMTDSNPSDRNTGDPGAATSGAKRDIPFTQFMRPTGRPIPVFIARPENIAAKADRIIANGFRFECESLGTGEISLTITDDERDWAIEVVQNGPQVPAAVDRLIEGFDA